METPNIINPVGNEIYVRKENSLINLFWIGGLTDLNDTKVSIGYATKEQIQNKEQGQMIMEIKGNLTKFEPNLMRFEWNISDNFKSNPEVKYFFYITTIKEPAPIWRYSQFFGIV